MKHLFTVLIVFSFILTSCSSENKSQVRPDSESSISGYFDNIPGTQLTLAHQSPEGIVPIDTTWVEEDGSFVFTTEMGDIEVYRIMIDFGTYLTVAAKKGDHITLEADGLDIYNDYYVEGSEESELIKIVVDETMAMGGKLDSIKLDINHQKSAKDSEGLYRSFEAQKTIYANFNAFSVEFITAHPNSIAAYFVVSGLQPDENPKEFLLVAENLKDTYPNFSYLPTLLEQTQFLQRAVLDSEAPELNYPNPEGVDVSLSSLRGKYVLVDFWASWCRPCRMENPNVVKLYEKYKNQGFEVYGYSLDEKMESWVEAIEVDGLTWIQTSDLKGWKAQGALDYGVQAIPATFLIGPDGNIITRDARGEKLAEKLAEIYGF